MKFIFKLYSCLLILIFVLSSSACRRDGNNTEAPASSHILVNQVGYPTVAKKSALIKTEASRFILKNRQGKIVLDGALSEWKIWDLSGDSVKWLDFSSVIDEGSYYLEVNDSIHSFPIVVNRKPYADLAKAALKAFYYNRSGTSISETYGGVWARESGHPDMAVYVHNSAVDNNRHLNAIISSSGGWYDAGDYNKYIVNSGITTYTLMLCYQLTAEYQNQLNINIPKSNPSLPDILNETIFNLRWMQTMQDSYDGGVYHKLTTKRFADFVMPKDANEKRFVVQKSTAATLDYAATLAYAYRTYSNFEGAKEFSDSCLNGAKRAWQWALDNPDVLYAQPSDIQTGEYKDTSLVDEWFWAASELYLSTGDSTYISYVNQNYTDPNTPKWDVVNTLGILSLITSNKKSEFDKWSNYFLAYAKLLVAIESTSPYKVSIDELSWGSNSDVANRAMLKQIAFYLTHDEIFYHSVQNDLNYLLGCNATGYSFVTGFGNKCPMNIHHRPSGADVIEEPVPGFLVGGPNIIVLDDCGAGARSTFPAKSYIDAQCSYSTNEVAINWNAPFVFLTSFINAYELE